jgi:hypothetical protein
LEKTKSNLREEKLQRFLTIVTFAYFFIILVLFLQKYFDEEKFALAFIPILFSILIYGIIEQQKKQSQPAELRVKSSDQRLGKIAYTALGAWLSSAVVFFIFGPLLTSRKMLVGNDYLWFILFALIIAPLIGAPFGYFVGKKMGFHVSKRAESSNE